MKTFIAIFIVILTGFSSHFSFCQDIYLSPTGNDTTGDGSIEKPFQSIEKGKAEILRIKANNGNPKPINIYLREGTYVVSSTIVFGPEFSGTQTNPVTFRSFNNEKVVVSGAEEISGWHQEGKLWVKDLSVTGQIKSFYSNTALLTLARTPGKGSFFHANGTNGKSSFYKQSFDHISSSWVNAEVDINVFQQWKHSRHKLAGISGNLIEINPEERRVLGDFDHRFAYYLENHLDMLDEPGEWFYDKTTRKLYYYPDAQEDINVFKGYVPLVNRIIEFRGTPASGTFVEHIDFKGISFHHSNWEMTYSASLPTAYITLEDAVIWCFGLKNSSFEDCEIAFGGGHGIWFYDGSKNNTIRNCSIHTLGGGGIYMKNEPGKEARATTYSGNNLIEGNKIDNTLIYDLNNIHNGAHGIWMGNVENITVSNCDISGTNGSGINIGFTDNVESVGARNIIVEKCRIHDILYDVTEDWGGIHMLGSMPGTILRNNFIYNVCGYRGKTYGIYHDNGNANVLVENNIIAGGNGEAVFAKGANHVYKNNFIVTPGVAAFKFTNLTGSFKASDNIIFLTRSRGVFSYGETRSRIAQLNFDNNIYWSSDCQGAQSLDFDGGHFESWQELGQDKNSKIANPGFADVKTLNFDIAGDLAKQMGIEPIEVKSIGLTTESIWYESVANIPKKEFYNGISLPEQYLVDQNFFDDFEKTAAGFLPSGADARASYSTSKYLGEYAPAVYVTDTESKTGTKSLLVRDQFLSSNTFNPNIRYYPMYLNEGTGIVEFDLKLKKGAILTIDNRSTDGASVILKINSEGNATLNGQVICPSIPADKWIKVKIEIPTDQVSKTCKSTLLIDSESYILNTILSEKFKWATSYFLADANVFTELYIDNVSFSFTKKNFAQNDFFSLYEGQSLAVLEPGVLGNDTTDNFKLSEIKAYLVENVSNGSLSLSENGSFTYIPKSNFIGDDTFRYMAVYSSGDTCFATVKLSVIDLSTSNVDFMEKNVNKYSLFPNPVSSKSKVFLSLHSSQKANSVKISDLSGKYVSIILDNYLDAANVYEVNLNKLNLKTGIYLFSLESGGNFSEARKVFVY